MTKTPAGEPQRFRTILVATDFSKTATAALKWATEVARGHGARIEVIHAVEAVSMQSMPVALQEELTRSLTLLEETVRQAGVEVSSRFEHGKPWEVITEAERERQADLIVIGSRGQTAYAPPLLGSRADRVLRTAVAPVLTVHPGDAGRETTIRTVLVATDFSEEAALATSCAVRFARALPPRPRIVLLHAWQPLVQYEYAWSGVPINPADDAIDQAETLLASAAAALAGDDVDVETTLRQGYPAHVIENEARALGADLIALGTHGRSGLKRMLLGSVAERVLHHAPCPVLTVRHPEVSAPVRLSEEAAVI